MVEFRPERAPRPIAERRAGQLGSRHMDELIIGPNLPRQVFFVVEPHPDCREIKLTDAQDRSLKLLVIKLMYIAGDIAPDEATGIRCIALTTRTRTKDGKFLDPVRAYYRMSDDGKTALLLDVQPLKRDRVVRMSHGDIFETIRDEVIRELRERLGS
jgi:hypothetical protein